MLPDVKINRARPTETINPLKWSEDGQLAFASAAQIVILNPLAQNINTSEKSSKTSAFEEIKCPCVEISPSMFDYFISDKYQDTNIATQQEENEISSIEWSHSGSSLNRGCFLAVLTKRLEVFILEKHGMGKNAKWEIRFNLTGWFLEYLKFDFEQPFSNNILKKVRTHAISWSSRFSDSNWSELFLAVGNENDEICIFKVNHKSLEFEISVPISGVDWIKQLYWSTWKLINGTYISFLLAVAKNNSLQLQTIQYSEGLLKITEEPITLLSKSRFDIFTVSCEQLKETSPYIVSVATLAEVHVFIIYSPENIKKLSSKVTESSTISSLLIFLEEDENTILRVVYRNGNITKYRIDTINKTLDQVEEFAGPSQLLTKRITSWKSSSDVEDAQLTIYGSALSPHKSISAFLYKIDTPNSLNYSIMANSSCRILFAIANSRTLKSPGVYEGSSLTISTEISFIGKILAKDVRSLYFESLLERFKEDNKTIEDTVSNDSNIIMNADSPTLEHIIKALSESLEHYIFQAPRFNNLRFHNYLSSNDDFTGTLYCIAKVVLSFIKKYPLTRKFFSSIDSAIINSFLCFSADSGGFIDPYSCEIKSDICNETFDFTNQKSHLSLKSASGHLWKRCSITLLPLLDMNIKTCNACGNKVIKLIPESSPMSNNDKYDNQDISGHISKSWLAKTLLSTFEVCPYCGGRYETRL